MQQQHAILNCWRAAAAFALSIVLGSAGVAQIAPDKADIASYKGLHAAAQKNDPRRVSELLGGKAQCEIKDSQGRTPVHVAAHASSYAAFAALISGGCDVRALDNQHYDAITIAAVDDDVRMVRLALKLGGNAKAITSPYEGTALIAAAHLGHVEVVKALIEGRAPLNHVNNLGWTALIEAVVLGNGQKPHIETVRALVQVGADRSIPDRNGSTARQLAEQRGFTEIVKLIKP